MNAPPAELPVLYLFLSRFHLITIKSEAIVHILAYFPRHSDNLVVEEGHFGIFARPRSHNFFLNIHQVMHIILFFCVIFINHLLSVLAVLAVIGRH